MGQPAGERAQLGQPLSRKGRGASQQCARGAWCVVRATKARGTVMRMPQAMPIPDTGRAL